MTRYLFTLGVGVEDRPQRWLGICPIYAGLARGLFQLGHEAHFVVNPEALDAGALAGFPVQIGDHERLRAVATREHFDFGFIWGGRIGPDLITREILEAQGIKPIFSELGWFPQKGTVYFDFQGTNSMIKFVEPKKLCPVEALKFSLARRKYCREQYNCAPRWHIRPLGPSPLQVFVPLQDETDTNITEDSPFRKMDDMIKFLSRAYPNDHFIVRPHPRADLPIIGDYPNVKLQDVSVNPIEQLGRFDLVIGINSTLLSEAAFLHHRVACFGNGLARLYKLAVPLDPMKPPGLLQDIPDPGLQTNAFHYLCMVKQLSQAKLSSPSYLFSTYLKDMLGLAPSRRLSASR